LCKDLLTRTPSPKSALPEFHLNDAVRLLVGHGDVPAGAVGRILGKFPRRHDSTYAVCFIDKRISVLEVRANEIGPLDGPHAAN
jgi:hypothetical protein